MEYGHSHKARVCFVDNAYLLITDDGVLIVSTLHASVCFGQYALEVGMGCVGYYIELRWGPICPIANNWSTSEVVYLHCLGCYKVPSIRWHFLLIWYRKSNPLISFFLAFLGETIWWPSYRIVSRRRTDRFSTIEMLSSRLLLHRIVSKKRIASIASVSRTANSGYASGQGIVVAFLSIWVLAHISNYAQSIVWLFIRMCGGCWLWNVKHLFGF